MVKFPKTAATVAAVGAGLLGAAGATATYRPQRRPGAPAGHPAGFEALRESVVGKLQAAVRCPTVSYPEEERIDIAPFDELHALLREQFPRLHAGLGLTRVGRHGLLFHWKGRGPGDPVVLMAHQDVVPIDKDAAWAHPAFGAEVADGMLWGRGTLDDKGCLITTCEAVERLLQKGFVPARDVYLSFGANEEVGGDCATLAAAELERRGVHPWFVLDEGGALAGGAFPGVAAPIAVIGVAEKGTTNLELRTHGPGGHASTPARNDTTARLARAILRLEDNPFPPRIPVATVEMVDRLGRHAALPVRAAFALTRRLPGVLSVAFDRLGPETAGMTRTTLAVTQLFGAPGPNVIPSTASAVVNLRVMIGETVQDCIDRIRKVIADDSVEINVLMRTEPSALSPSSGPAWDHLVSSIADVFPEAIPSPYLMMGGTDSRFLTHLCPNVYRFAPFRMSKAQRESIHSYDERIGVDAVAEGVLWYQHLIEGLPG
ncbi:M20/M25/M40 family metallo-hydrolase [Leekyejoonella antrihumi]|uniref:M20/M25/M40 family metallo-hydrolase n=1 Tax=Leekyejoonella antrihumi TaxID=1660198 RepID=A0A563E3S1_9MICO|nr:M20/M25/M40 family metallo-hydrolase [Leekyejoonella antrihumi]TWP36851.1 M20/M25/M40 family metallo-hydrolase [Leekyejoonella antrihumi]